MRKRDQIAITERELNAMTGELDTLHKETFPGVTKTLAEFNANLAHLRTTEGTGRRNFLAGVGGVVVLGAVAACSSSGGGTGGSSNPPAPQPTSNTDYVGDLKVVALAAALENLAVAAYGMALKAAGGGAYGKVPAAVGTFVQTAMGQHADHAKAWNGVLKQAKLKPISGTPLTIAAGEVKKLKAAKTIPDVATVALGLENAAAQTYLFAAGNVTDPGGIMTAATIEPVETMHAAILNFVLGQYPVPDTFIKTDMAVQPTAFTG